MKNPKFTLFRGENFQFYFNLRARNGEIILASEGYMSKSGAKRGIVAVKKNAKVKRQFKLLESKNDQQYFVLTAKNYQIIGVSETYTTTGARDNGVKAVMSTATKAPIDDQSTVTPDIVPKKKKPTTKPKTPPKKPTPKPRPFPVRPPEIRICYTNRNVIYDFKYGTSPLIAQPGYYMIHKAEDVTVHGHLPPPPYTQQGFSQLAIIFGSDVFVVTGNIHSRFIYHNGRPFHPDFQGYRTRAGVMVRAYHYRLIFDFPSGTQIGFYSAGPSNFYIRTQYFDRGIGICSRRIQRISAGKFGKP